MEQRESIGGSGRGRQGCGGAASWRGCYRSRMVEAVGGSVEGSHDVDGTVEGNAGEKEDTRRTRWERPGR